MENLIKELSDLRGISGFEYLITDKIKAKFEPYADEVYIDNLGSVVAHKKSSESGSTKIMIEAHCDEIGLMVKSITDEGFITFTNVGGIDNRILPSLEVVVHGKEDVSGVVGIKPDFLQEEDKTVKMKDMAIDTGLALERVKELISVGDSITIAQSVGKLGERQWSGKSLDDRASVAALVAVMKELSKNELLADVFAVATVQEEVGCRGAKTSAFSINPDIAIAVDVTHAVTPDNSEDAFKTGSGAIISVGPNLHPKLTQKLISVCKKNDIPYDIEVSGGDTGTDAWEIQVAREGIPTALLSIPLKYMHTSVETLEVSDVNAVAKLMYEFISEVKGDLSWLNL